MKFFPWSPSTWRATANAVLDLPFYVFIGVVLMVLFSLGTGLLVIFVGVFILAFALLLARWFGNASRVKLGHILLAEVPARPRSPLTGNLWSRTWALLRSPGNWRDLLHAVVMLFLGPLWFALVVTFWAAAFATVTFPFYATSIPDSAPAIDWDISGIAYDPRGAGGRIVAAAAGVALIFFAAWVAGLTSRADVGLARALLGPNEAELLRAQVDTLRTTRAAVVDAADEERRRIERDLHDGVQPQLVSLAMNLGMAQRKLEDDPEGAAELMKQAHDESKKAILELRNVIRGVHPAVLAERGLDPALSALAARSPVPVAIEVDPALSHRRLDPTIEAIAYFVVAESLTNVARHAKAEQASVGLRIDGDRLVVRISDDGKGGAMPAPGSGLRGLTDRVAAVDGTLTIHSPPGAGTTVTAVLPCAS